MPIEVRCQCGKKLRAPDKLAGKQTACPGCGAKVTIPGLSATETDEYEEDVVPAAPVPRQIPPARQPPVAVARPGASVTRQPVDVDPYNPYREPVAEAPRYSIDEFIQRTEQRDQGQGFFELESPYMLEINLDGLVWTKKGSMIAYTGNIKFTREGIFEKGLGKFLKKAVSGEGTKLTKAEGQGQLYLADSGKRISVLQLEDESIFVNGNDLLALEESIEWDIKMMKRITSMLAGGLFNVKLTGTGKVAITSHFQPMTLRVRPDRPVVTDPNATIAWSGNLTPQLKSDFSLKTFIGRGSGESIQMLFEGDGFVVVQPFEEVYFQTP